MRRTIFLCCVLMSVTLMDTPAYSGRPLALYDNFNKNLINHVKWYGCEINDYFTLRENVRQIKARALHLQSRGYGLSQPGAGAQYGHNQLRFTYPNRVTAIKATIQINGYKLTGCDANPSSPQTHVRARLHGIFFNTGTPAPGSKVNDVIAYAGIRRAMSSTDPPDVLRAHAWAGVCTDQQCFSSTTIGYADLGTVTVGQKTTLRIEWDKVNHRFLTQRDNGPEIAMPYTVSDTGPPSLALKDLDLPLYLSDCSENPMPTGYMDALFDDVYVNKSAAALGKFVNEDETLYDLSAPVIDAGL